MGNFWFNLRKEEVVPIEIFTKIGTKFELAVTLKVKRRKTLRDIINKYKNMMVNELNYDLMLNVINITNWDFIFEKNLSIDDKWRRFIDAIKNAFNFYCPKIFISVTLKSENSSDWFTVATRSIYPVKFYVMDRLLTENDTSLLQQINETDCIEANILSYRSRPKDISTTIPTDDSIGTVAKIRDERSNAQNMKEKFQEKIQMA